MGSTTFTDSSSAGHTITTTGSPKHVASKIGTGMAVFDGTDDNITIRKEAGWLDANDFTIEGLSLIHI